jgi:hypothetical protein
MQLLNQEYFIISSFLADQTSMFHSTFNSCRGSFTQPRNMEKKRIESDHKDTKNQYKLVYTILFSTYVSCLLSFQVNLFYLVHLKI